MTRRERIEARVQRRQEWAAGRHAKAESLSRSAHEMASAIPFGQPILVGHHSEKRDRSYRERIGNKYQKAYESSKMATHHEQRAEGLQHQLDRSIFSDDDNAPDALEARAREREAARDHCKVVNAAIRKMKRQNPRPETILAELVRSGVIDEAEAENLARSFALQPYHGLGYPSYHITNLGANIRRDRQRIEQVKREATLRAEAEAAPDGVVIRRNHDANWVTVRFAEKPDRAILDALRDAGFGWGGGAWSGRLDKLPAVVAGMVTS